MSDSVQIVAGLLLVVFGITGWVNGVPCHASTEVVFGLFILSVCLQRYLADK
jgi:hypothetical protein